MQVMSESKRQRPVVLAIGGSDSAGLAGIQADQRAIAALGGHPATAVTAVTAQNSAAVAAVEPVSPDVLQRQIEACRALSPRAVKIGLLATEAQVRACAEAIKHLDDPVAVVLDPVLYSSSGHPLAGAGVAGAIRDLLLPLATLVTPNRAEVAVLTGCDPGEPSNLPQVAARLAQPAAVYLKGGHWSGAFSSDYFRNGARCFWLSSPRLATRHQRGTGCTLAAAAATALALGHDLADAAVIAKMTVNQGLRQGYGWEAQAGTLAVSGFPDDGHDLPLLTNGLPGAVAPGPFPPCCPPSLGLYPVVNRAAWLETLLPAGVTTIQLRVKDLEDEALREEIHAAIAIAQRHRARLFINDHWRLALELGAYGVHLGQEDLAEADLDAIRAAGLRLGISTHCHYEVARAAALRPSYLACGPIYPTTSKIMPWVPHDLAGLHYWRRVLRAHPLVAIGGIDDRRLTAVHATGVDGIAMISAITRAPDPAATAYRFATLLARRPQTQPPCEVEHEPVGLSELR